MVNFCGGGEGEQVERRMISVEYDAESLVRERGGFDHAADVEEVMEMAAVAGAPPRAAATADAAGGLGGGHPRRVAFAVFENIADDLVEAPRIRRVAADGSGEDEAVFAGVLEVAGAVPSVCALGEEIFPPWVGGFCTGAGGSFPLVEGWEPTTDPPAIGACVLAADLGDRVIGEFHGIRAAGAERMFPICAIHPLPFPFGAAFAADEAPAISLGAGLVMGCCDEGGKLGVGRLAIGDEIAGRLQGVGAIQRMVRRSERMAACGNVDEPVVIRSGFRVGGGGQREGESEEAEPVHGCSVIHFSAAARISSRDSRV